MLSQAVQDYLKTIYKLEKNGTVSTTGIAKELNISGASVTGMLKRLSSLGMVDYNSYKGVRLTVSGRKIALEIIRHHRLLELYLKEMLGFSLEKVHDEACRLEHYISKEFVEKIDNLLGNPEFDPHGHPIPSKEGEIADYSEEALHKVDPGKIVIIRRLSDEDPEMLAYFETKGIVPGVKVKVLQKEPFNGPIKVMFDDDTQIIGNEIAKNVFIEYVDLEN
jgi:DtxR family transcriptional regulator, Mn-dependent transcriptional regulator